jgi:hypothetical protein
MEKSTVDNKLGKRTWIFPDMELPPKGDFELKGHESIIILNMNEKDAHIKINLYFEDRDPVVEISAIVNANRVRCLRTDNPTDMGGVSIEFCKQYSLKLVSDVSVVAQYGRLDTRQQNMAFYTTAGYCV